ncbi:MAG: hypothetical protein PF518_08420 [Spirochaetaceae bacterium]|jgi:hypothetical protein|nr:hypothetical protein [Spirochaetaceae bacterium]
MKLFFIFLLLLLSIQIYSDESFIQKDGALLWAENCMGCHIPKYFLAAEPDQGYVDELVETIDYNINFSGSAMSALYSLKNDEIDKIANFLIFGSHGDQWENEGSFHGQSAREFGSENCYKCHDNESFYKNPPISCNSCHS